jgi:tRNA threonylcarbamoyl adenosine modification protein YeaZ
LDVIFPMLNSLLKRAGIETTQINAIGAVVGPGSFTGIRVGLAMAQGLADGLGIPAYGITGFDALQRDGGQGTGEGEILVLESKRDELYVSYEQIQSMLTPQQILKILAGKKILHNLGAGSALAPLQTVPSLARAAAAFAHDCAAAAKTPEILTPYYLRDADAKPMAG